MSRYISEDLRNLVVARAESLCEYCLIHEDDTFFGCQVDHVISVKHGGPTEPDNLAYACAFCNRQKGSDIGSILWRTGEFVRFFNPRTDRWSEHFRLNGAVIEPLTGIGEVTVRILDGCITQNLQPPYVMGIRRGGASLPARVTSSTRAGTEAPPLQVANSA